MSRTFLSLLGLAGSLSAYTINYPFPYQAAYPNGIKANSRSGDTVLTKFNSWKSSYYTVCSNDANKARVKWMDNTGDNYSGSCNLYTGSCTVSEGIGYGMLITVYMDNATNQTKSMFDKLWAYYQGFSNGNGLMHWQVDDCNGATSSAGAGAAPDGDEDVALALCMAYKQWGDDTYLTAAKSLLGKIWGKEINSSSYLMKIDDQGTSDQSNLYNPSYFSVGAYRVFATVDNSHNWASVASNTLDLIKKNRNSTTGLVSDWCNASGTTQDHNNSGSGNFGYDAVRNPWRVALDYIWFGTAASKSHLDLISNWIFNSGVTNYSGSAGIFAGYTQAGASTTEGHNALYSGAFAMTTVTNTYSFDTTWIRKGLSTQYLSSSTTAGAEPNYYNMSWKVLYLLTLTGNFQNLWGTVGTTGLSESSQVPVSSAWTARVGTGAIDLSGTGAARAQLLDLSGRILSQESGVASFSLRKPAAPGTYLVRILGEHPQTIPVFSN